MAQFAVAKRKRERRKGTVKLTVEVPGPGHLVISGDKVRSRSKWPRGQGDTKVNAGIRARGKAKRTLKRRGRVKVSVELAFTPDGGTQSEQGEKLKLKKR